MTEHVLTEVDQGVLVVRLNRPKKLNALTSEMYSVMADAIETAENDRSIKVVLYTSTSNHFTAGNDLNDFLSQTPDGSLRQVDRFINNMVSTDVPLMAAVEGVAVGIGTTMLLHFDQVLASENARFSLPFINLGLVPEAGSSALLVNACGYKKAAELLMQGDMFLSAKALECGIVSRVCPPQNLQQEALAAARALAAKPVDALRATKRLLRRPPEPLAQRVEAERDTFGHCLATPIAREAMTAILEKRAPDFTGLD